MSKVQPTRRSKASAQSSIAQQDESGEGPQPQYPDREVPRAPGSGNQNPDPDDLTWLEYSGAAGDAEPDEPEEK